MPSHRAAAPRPLLLRLRHWQVFGLLFVLPLLLQQGLPRLFSALGAPLGELALLPIQVLPSAALTWWLWHMGLLLHRRLPLQIQISHVFLHLGAAYCLFYTLLFVYTLGIVRESIEAGSLPYGLLLLLAPMHLLATFCFLYLVYFIARSVVSVEQQRVVRAGEYAGTVLLVLFLPVGIWALQPRLNRLGAAAAAHKKTANTAFRKKD